MGWMTTSQFEQSGLTIRDYLDRQFACDAPDFPKFEILDSSLVNRCEYYAAMRRTDRKTGEAIIFALIALVSYNKRAEDGHTLGWKDMEECSGPYACRCPERILAKLDPPHNDNAAQWRARCRAWRARERDLKQRLVPGAELIFEEPLRFSSGVYTRFTMEKHGRRTLFRAPDGTLCRIPKLSERPFALHPPHEAAGAA